MKTFTTLLFAIVAATATQAHAADDARLGRIAVGADTRAVDWSCDRPGAPDFKQLAMLGYPQDARLYAKRVALATKIRAVCADQADATRLVIVPADASEDARVAVR